MALLSNINDLFSVDSTGAIKFNNLTGTDDQVLIANTGTSPTWVDVDTIIGGPYLPLTGGTLAGAGNLVVGGTLTGFFGLLTLFIFPVFVKNFNLMITLQVFFFSIWIGILFYRNQFLKNNDFCLSGE